MMDIGLVGTVTKTITEKDVDLFVDISGDHNPIHINEDEAQRSIFGHRIVPGFLVGSLISATIATELSDRIMVYIEQSMRFLRPVYIGDTCTAEVVVDEVVNKEKGVYRLITKVLNQNKQVVIDGYAVVMCLK